MLNISIHFAHLYEKYIGFEFFWTFIKFRLNNFNIFGEIMNNTIYYKEVYMLI